jgi:hypothetical protein
MEPTRLERDPKLLISSLLLSIVLMLSGFYSLKAMNPIGFIILVPAIFFAYHTLWLFLNPFALVFEDKVEIKQRFFKTETWVFNDITKVTVSGKGKLFVTYHDGEIESLSSTGIKRSHKALLKNSIEEAIAVK